MAKTIGQLSFKNLCNAAHKQVGEDGHAADSWCDGVLWASDTIAQAEAQLARLREVEKVARQLVEGSHPIFANKCEHVIYGYEMCTNCYDEALLEALHKAQEGE